MRANQEHFLALQGNQPGNHRGADQKNYYLMQKLKPICKRAFDQGHQ